MASRLHLLAVRVEYIGFFFLRAPEGLKFPCEIILFTVTFEGNEFGKAWHCSMN